MLQSVSRDIIEIEQYMDFLRNRMFRQTLFCRAEAKLDRATRAQAILNLRVASNSRPEAEPQATTADDRVTFRRRASVLTTSDPVVIAAMHCLREAWPASVPFLELAAIARSSVGGRFAAVQADTMSTVTQSLAETLIRCFATSQVDLHAASPTFTTTVSEHPIVSPLARVQATYGSLVTDRKHGSATLDDFQRQLLILLDGTRDQAALLEALVQKVQSRDLLLHQQGRPVSDLAAIRSTLEQSLVPALESLARMALLIE